MRHHLACLVLACLTTLPAIDVPAPAVLPDAQAYAVLVIPDLRATLTHIEAAATAFGQPLPPGMLASGLGGALGDPGLANLGAGPIFAIAAPGVPLPTWAVIIPSTNPGAYAAVLAQQGLATEALPTSLVIAQTIDGVDLGKRLAPALAATAPKTPATDVRLLLATDRLAAAYLPFLTQALAQASQAQARMAGANPAAAANSAKALEIFAAIIQPLAQEAGTLQLDLALGAAGLRIDTLNAPRPGGILGKGLIAPRPAGAKSFTSRLGAGEGHLTMAGRINPAVITALAELLAPLSTNPKTSALITPELVNLTREAATIYTGELAVRQGVGGSLAGQEGFYGISNAAKAATCMDRMSALFAKGALADLYRDLGFTMTLQPSIRPGPTGVRIDRLSFAIDATKLPPGQGDLMAKMMKPLEFAYAPEALVMANDPARLDRLLGSGLGPCTLAAEKTLGPGWDGYIDYDLGAQLRLQSAFIPGGAMGPAAMFARMPVGHPLAIAWAIRDGRVRTTLDIPMALATAMQRAATGGETAPAADPASPKF